MFGSAFAGPVMRMADAPPAPGKSPLGDDDERKIVHVERPVTGGRVGMGTDTPEAREHTLVVGSMVSRDVAPDTRARARRLVAVLTT